MPATTTATLKLVPTDAPAPQAGLPATRRLHIPEQELKCLLHGSMAWRKLALFCSGKPQPLESILQSGCLCCRPGCVSRLSFDQVSKHLSRPFKLKRELRCESWDETSGKALQTSTTCRQVALRAKEALRSELHRS